MLPQGFSGNAGRPPSSKKTMLSSLSLLATISLSFSLSAQAQEGGSYVHEVQGGSGKFLSSSPMVPVYLPPLGPEMVSYLSEEPCEEEYKGMPLYINPMKPGPLKGVPILVHPRNDGEVELEMEIAHPTQGDMFKIVGDPDDCEHGQTLFAHSQMNVTWDKLSQTPGENGAHTFLSAPFPISGGDGGTFTLCYASTHHDGEFTPSGTFTFPRYALIPAHDGSNVTSLLNAATGQAKFKFHGFGFMAGDYVVALEAPPRPPPTADEPLDRESFYFTSCHDQEAVANSSLVFDLSTGVNEAEMVSPMSTPFPAGYTLCVFMGRLNSPNDPNPKFLEVKVELESEVIWDLTMTPTYAFDKILFTGHGLHSDYQYKVIRPEQNCSDNSIGNLVNPDRMDPSPHLTHFINETYRETDPIDWSFMGETKVCSGSGEVIYEPVSHIVQKVSVDATTGTLFRLVFDGEETNCIAWDATAMDLEVELEMLSSIFDVEVTATMVGGNRDYMIDFTGNGGGGAVNMFEANSAGCGSEATVMVMTLNSEGGASSIDLEYTPFKWFPASRDPIPFPLPEAWTTMVKTYFEAPGLSPTPDMIPLFAGFNYTLNVYGMALTMGDSLEFIPGHQQCDSDMRTPYFDQALFPTMTEMADVNIYHGLYTSEFDLPAFPFSAQEVVVCFHHSPPAANSNPPASYEIPPPHEIGRLQVTGLSSSEVFSAYDYMTSAVGMPVTVSLMGYGDEPPSYLTLASMGTSCSSLTATGAEVPVSLMHISPMEGPEGRGYAAEAVVTPMEPFSDICVSTDIGQPFTESGGLYVPQAVHTVSFGDHFYPPSVDAGTEVIAPGSDHTIKIHGEGFSPEDRIALLLSTDPDMPPSCDVLSMYPDTHNSHPTLHMAFEGGISTFISPEEVHFYVGGDILPVFEAKAATLCYNYRAGKAAGDYSAFSQQQDSHEIKLPSRMPDFFFVPDLPMPSDAYSYEVHLVGARWTGAGHARVVVGDTPCEGPESREAGEVTNVFYEGTTGNVVVVVEVQEADGEYEAEDRIPLRKVCYQVGEDDPFLPVRLSSPTVRAVYQFENLRVNLPPYGALLYHETYHICIASPGDPAHTYERVLFYPEEEEEHEGEGDEYEYEGSGDGYGPGPMHPPGLEIRHGVYYDGPTMDDLPHGFGSMVFIESGDVFSGFYQLGRKEGYGVLLVGDPHSPLQMFEGEFRNDMRNGWGKLTYRNGKVFEGHFKDGKRDGEGTLRLANGDEFEGTFKEGKRHGHGQFVRYDGKVQSIHWEDKAFRVSVRPGIEKGAHQNETRFIGCVADGPARDLPIQVADFAPLSIRDPTTSLSLIPADALPLGNVVSECEHLCRAGNFKFFGLQEGTQCHCGNSYGKLSVEWQDMENSKKAFLFRHPSECNFKCPGHGLHDTEVSCGGVWRNSVYQIGDRPLNIHHEVGRAEHMMEMVREQNEDWMIVDEGLYAPPPPPPPARPHTMPRDLTREEEEWEEH